MATFAIFHDAALTQPVNGANPLQISQLTDGSSGPYDTSVYIGSTAAAGSKQIRAASNPGVDQITLTPSDAATGSGSPGTDVKLALSAGALGAATGGAAVNLGTAIFSGTANALRVYVRVTDSTAAAATNSDLSLDVSSVIESAAP